MVNRERRTLLADQIHALIAGFTSNYEFDDWLLNKLTFGRYPCLPRPKEGHRQWQTHGDHSVWPFIRRSDYDRIARNSCWLHVAAV